MKVLPLDILPCYTHFTAVPPLAYSPEICDTTLRDTQVLRDPIVEVTRSAVGSTSQHGKSVSDLRSLFCGSSEVRALLSGRRLEQHPSRLFLQRQRRESFRNLETRREMAMAIQQRADSLALPLLRAYWHPL